MSSFRLVMGDCLAVLKDLPANSMDSVITDPPAGISFMGKAWDDDKGGSKQWIAWMTEVMKECLRVLKPGAHGLVWAIPRTSHWTATALEDAGFEIRDVVTHIFGSGFPKSLDISKAIDKAAGVQGEPIGKNPAYRAKQLEHDAQWETAMRPEFKYGPATPEAKQWQGWGTALKPASEHWILVRKPLSEKTVAANVLKHGTGGLNIDASRVEAQDAEALAKNWNRQQSEKAQGNSSGAMGLKAIDLSDRAPTGRFPANLVLSHNEDCVEVGTKKVKSDGHHANKTIGFEKREYKGQGRRDGTETVPAWECTSGCAVAALDEQSGVSKSHSNKLPTQNRGGSFGGGGNRHISPSDSGGASRFFYCAKASKSDKNNGLDLSTKKAVGARPNSPDISGRFPDHDMRERVGNFHPTVKSTKLMSYLIKLITPPGGIVLDPFTGSGSTGVAALREGYLFFGVEREFEYFEIARKRCEVLHG